MTDACDNSPAPGEARSLIERIDRALPLTTVTAEPSAATVWCAEVEAEVRAGRDPLAPWRHALEAQQDSGDRPHVAAAFVLQWWCEVAATPIAYAAELAAVRLVPGAGLGFELAPGLYPDRIILDPQLISLSSAEPSDRNEPDGPTVLSTDPGRGSIRPVDPGREGALARGRAAYGLVVSEVVRHHAPEVKMSTHQRWGVVDDMWAIAVRRARGAAGRPTGPEPRRASCCFIYALSGMVECAACPRGGRAERVVRE